MSGKTSYRLHKYNNEEGKFNSYGITPLTPNISDLYEGEEETDSIIEFPMVILIILAIVVVVINIPGVF